MNKAEMLEAFDAAPVGIAVASHRVIVSCNLPFAEMLGYKRDDLLGQSFRILYPSAEDFERVRDIGLESLQKTGHYSDERMMRRRDGVPVWCRFRGRSLSPEEPLAKVVMSFAQIADQGERPPLSPREREVLGWLSRGLTSKAIARELGLSPRTIEDVRSRLLRRFKARTTAELLGRMISLG